MRIDEQLEQKRRQRIEEIVGRLTSFPPEAQIEISWLLEQLHLSTLRMNCDVCGGQPENCAPCICGGTGKLKDAAANRLTRMVETEMKLGDALYALRGVKAKWPEVAA